ncbi:HD domain-containing protein [Acidaminobacter hydrogenoformans]|uniref:HDIG domain-containing protein n=1 Tax=Acidaminobacter hydrogenoformans DSM 2784 TaxID=1120920 RepID=A0A1G5S065_9FIRM|nr:HD domain-containing protein [Acidaminobacter hydrogenoformans]SCZ79508.1 HDIG domain-containing protein [Acidaminobacter hydrogenoformans DSM 2784]
MGKKMISNQNIEVLLPEINLISSEKLRHQCINALLDAFETGGWNWDNIYLCPVSINKVSNRDMNHQIDHVRIVIKIAISMYDLLEENYKQNSDLRDTIIAGALLHDIGKFIEFTLKGDTVSYSDSAKLIRHPLGGAIIASRNGICDEILHIIATHSFEGRESSETLASMIVKAADEIAFKYIKEFE